MSAITIEDQDRGRWVAWHRGAIVGDGDHVRVLVVLGGAGFDGSRLREEALGADAVVAADSGAALCLDAGVPLEAVVGDFDSLDDATRARLDPIRLHRFEMTNSNDLEKALAWIAGRFGADAEIVLAAGTTIDGGRMDHALANLGPVVREPHGRVTMMDGEGRLFALRRGRATLSGLAGRKLSVLPWSLVGVVVSETGVRYPLDRARLTLGGRGVSNEIVADEATVTVDEGVALVWVSA
jgi:thiamine pyrophosphokinase